MSESKVWVVVLVPSEGFRGESVPGLSPSSVWMLLPHHCNPPSPPTWSSSYKDASHMGAQESHAVTRSLLDSRMTSS